MPTSKIEYPKELTLAAWKKAKSIFTNNTGISDKLRDAEKAFAAARADIDAINNIYDGGEPTGGFHSMTHYPETLAECRRLTNSAKIQNYKKSLWAVRDHCTKVANDKKMLSKQKALVLSMAKTADFESVIVNANTISGYLGQEMRRRVSAYDTALQAIFDGALLQTAVKRAVAFLLAVNGSKTAEAKVAAFNTGCTKAARDITQMVGNRIAAPQKLKIPYQASNKEREVMKGLQRFANGYKGATAKNIDAEVREMSDVIKQAATIVSAKAPTVKELWGAP